MRIICHLHNYTYSSHTNRHPRCFRVGHAYHQEDDSSLALLLLHFWSGLSHLWIWTHHFLQIGIPVKTNNRMANSVDPEEMAAHNSVDPDEMVHYDPSHLNLHCLPFCCWFVLVYRFAKNDVSKFKNEKVYFRNAGVKGLRENFLPRDTQGQL